VNYRHAFHAGNFADVFKHAVLTRIFLYLGQKETAFRVIDTHAGEGLYDLSGEAAEKTAEWLGGIGRLIEARASVPPDVEALLAPYLAVVGRFMTGEAPHYPGSPAIAAALLRKQDRMIFCDAHPEVVEALDANLGRDKRARIIAIDGFTGLKAYVPPIERRGLVLIDPPFEAKDEFARVVSGLEAGLKRWPGGTYMIWFPIKDRAAVADFYASVEAAIAIEGVRDALRLEFWIDAASETGPLASNGLIIVNPPFVLEKEAQMILPFLARALGNSSRAGYQVARLGPS
jgi:23S rRNA (adenine2030-N6)-methyltransferase